MICTKKGTVWWRREKQAWRAKERAAVGRGWPRHRARDQTYDKSGYQLDRNIWTIRPA